MYKILILSGAGVMLFGAGMLASAQTPYPGYYSPQYPPQVQCPQLTRDLYRGLDDFQTGGQVSGLQQFLRNRYGDQRLVGGYFGPLTQQYVTQLQREQGLSPVGIVGPMTRAAIQRLCGGGGYPYPQPQPTAPSVSSVSGPTSLNVGQSGTWQVRATSAGGYLTYSVVWGDEQYYSVYAMGSPSQETSSTGTFTHSYARAGTYSPRFTVVDQYGRSASASASVTVTGSSCGWWDWSCYWPPQPQPQPDPLPQPQPGTTFSGSPATGTAPLTVQFSGTVSSQGYSINFGDGTSSGDIGCGHGGCQTTPGQASVSISHTYTTPGTYTAKLRRHFSIVEAPCAGVDCNVVGTVTITVGSPQTQTQPGYCYYDYTAGTYICSN